MACKSKMPFYPNLSAGFHTVITFSLYDVIVSNDPPIVIDIPYIIPISWQKHPPLVGVSVFFIPCAARNDVRLDFFAKSF